MSRVSGDPKLPRRHFRLRHPAELAPAEAQSIYDIVRDALRNGYARSGRAVARRYQTWRKYNTAPYLSKTHGNHYLNNYANPTGEAYGLFERAGTLPAGTVVAKDSFAVTRTHGLVLGPLFVMEKMARGFNSASGDWKYTLILPDGVVLGETNGDGSERVAYCVDCHVMRQQRDHLYFVPQEYRVERD